jgi:transposase
LWLIVTVEEPTMRKTMKSLGEKIVKDIKCATRKHYLTEEKIRIVTEIEIKTVGLPWII